jgi:PAS domain S-box-containing protein
MNKPTIVCIDDELLVLSSLRDALSQVLGDDFAVEIAESGEEALEIIQELTKHNREVPLVISDQLMPGIKGDQLLAEIHAQHPKTLKVMLTGQASPEAIGHAVNAANLFRYVAKPWNDATLIGIVREALSSYFQERNIYEINQALEKINAELEQKVRDRTRVLQHRIEVETLVASISREFMNLLPEQVDGAINSALQRLGELFQADRSYLFQCSADGSIMNNTHEWCAPTIHPQIHRGQNISAEQLPWFIAQIHQMEIVRVLDVQTMPPEAQIDQAEFQLQQIKSLICVPIVLRQTLFGCVGFDSVGQLRAWNEVQIQALRVVGGIFATMLDGHRWRTALQLSEKRFRQAFDNAPVGMALIATDGHYLRVNRSFCQIVGYTKAELLRRQFHDISHPGELDRNLELVRDTLSGKVESFQMEKRYIHQSGRIVWVLLHSSLIRNQFNKPEYFVTQILDISDRHQIDRLKNEFISIVSHELRTPLTSIHGSLGMLDSGVYLNQPDKAKQMLQIALSNSERLTRLVNDILDLERLESGKMEFNFVPCNTATLMQQAVDTVQAIADQTGVQLTLTPLAIEMLADGDAIVQTLVNLLSNAIKFSSPGSTVWLRADLIDDGAFCMLSVRDQGRGIPADKLERVFGRFQQVDVSDSRQKGGTGLGLAICKSIIEKHQGTIWVESALGSGSIFYIRLPLTPSYGDTETQRI